MSAVVIKGEVLSPMVRRCLAGVVMQDQDEHEDEEWLEVGRRVHCVDAISGGLYSKHVCSFSSQRQPQSHPHCTMTTRHRRSVHGHGEGSACGAARRKHCTVHSDESQRRRLSSWAAQKNRSRTKVGTTEVNRTSTECEEERRGIHVNLLKVCSDLNWPGWLNLGRAYCLHLIDCDCIT